MYRSDLNTRDRSGALAAVIAIHIALLFVLLHLSGTIEAAGPDSALRIIDLRALPPPPPPPVQRQQAKPRHKEGGSAPKNIKSEATPVMAPKPKIEIPPVQQIAAAEIPRTGAQATQGASDARGPGTGSGGAGTGSGGSGQGDGGGGGAVEPPHLITRVLRGQDIPRETLDDWPRGATVFMRLRVDARGNVSECTVDRGTGVPSIDNLLCNLAHDRLRFRPAVDRSGQAVAGWFGYAQPAPR